MYKLLEFCRLVDCILHQWLLGYCCAILSSEDKESKQCWQLTVNSLCRWGAGTKRDQISIFIETINLSDRYNALVCTFATWHIIRFQLLCLRGTGIRSCFLKLHQILTVRAHDTLLVKINCGKQWRSLAHENASVQIIPKIIFWTYLKGK
jgi:hypothetical protein